MICLGFDNRSKVEHINKYCDKHNIKKIFILSQWDIDWRFCLKHETIKWNELIEYSYFYRLLQEINSNSLIVINECLRTQNRNDLTYNCIRHYLNQTKHQLIFQYLPIINETKDIFILFDFDTRTKWKGQTDFELLKNANWICNPVNIKINLNEIFVQNKKAYLNLKNNLFENIGLRDPHTLPRRLHLFTGKYKIKEINGIGKYVVRNKRFQKENMYTYKDIIKKQRGNIDGNFIVFEFCHNFIVFSDFLYVTKQTAFEVLATNLKVDQWYFDRYSKWIDRINEIYSIIQ